MEHELPDEDQMRFYLEDQEHHTQNLMQNRREVERVIRHFDIPYSSRDEKLSRLAELAENRESSVYELGRLSVHIERLEEVMQEKERLRLEEEQNRETMAVMENHLDWLEIEVLPLHAGPENAMTHDRDR